MPIFLPWSVSLIYRMKPRSPLETFSVFLVCMMRSLTRNILGPNLISSSAERNGLTNSRMVSFSCSDDAAPSERKGERICTFSMEKCQRSPIHRCRRFHGAGNPASLLLKDLPFLPAPAVHAAFVQHYCCQTYQIPLRDLRGKITALAIGATFRGRSEDTACLFIFQSVECAGLTRRPFCFLFCFTFMYMTCLSQF